MIRRFTSTLKKVGFDLTAEQILDALWLAQHLGTGEPYEPAEPEPDYTAPPATTELPAETSEAAEPVKEERASGPLPPLSDTIVTPPPSPDSFGLYLPQTRADEPTSKGASGYAFRSPAAPALPGALEIARTLRPLMRRVPSTTDFVLDEEATVKRIAEEELWIPVLRPAQSRWLEVALVVDEGATMIVWRQTIAELQTLLERQGAFRDVRAWGLITDARDGKLRLHAGTGPKAQTERLRSPLELIDPRGRRLILIVSDCISPAWRDGSVAKDIATWGRSCPLALIQVLPQRLWSRTAIGAQAAYLRATLPGAPNTLLRAGTTKRISEKPSSNPLIPTITLDPKLIGPWASLIAGAGGGWAMGTSISTSSSAQDKGQGEERPPQSKSVQGKRANSNPEEVVRNFRRTASPLARQLASYLAAAPVLSLQIMRLIQQAMLPESKQVHLAEIFLGELLKEPLLKEGSAHPEDIQYHFIDGAREALLKHVEASDAIEVLNHVYLKISSYVESRVGQSFDFPSLIASPQLRGKITIPKDSAPFASVTTSILHSLGGQYSQIAQQLKASSVEVETPPPVSNPPDVQPEMPTVPDVISPPAVPDVISPQVIKPEPTYSHRNGSSLETEDWEYLMRRIREGKCTPFIGGGGSVGMLPSNAELARRWAEEFNYPMRDVDDLARVAQYIAVEAGPEYLKRQMMRQLDDARKVRRWDQGDEAHRRLAELPLPLYVTTNYDDMMEEALMEGGKKADWQVCEWKRELRRREWLRGSEERAPSSDRPLVYHLHGHRSEPDSLVITEDDHVDFATSLSRNDSLLPPRIQSALVDSLLLFVGYHMDDWRFRLLLRCLRSYLGRNRSDFHIVISPQPFEEEARTRRRENMEIYLERYSRSHNIFIYWGTFRDFAYELGERWTGR